MLFNMVYGVGLEVVGIVGAQIISADASVRVYLDSPKNSPAPDIAQCITSAVLRLECSLDSLSAPTLWRYDVAV